MAAHDGFWPGHGTTTSQRYPGALFQVLHCQLLHGTHALTTLLHPVHWMGLTTGVYIMLCYTG